MAAAEMLYADSTCALATTFLTLKGVTSFLGRKKTFQLADVDTFRYAPRESYPGGVLPSFGRDDENVWFTKDSTRWRRKGAILITLTNGLRYGFTPAHPTRVRDLLVKCGVTELR